MAELLVALIVTLSLVIGMAVLTPVFSAILIPTRTAMTSLGSTGPLALNVLSLWPLVIGAILLVGILASAMYARPQPSAGYYGGRY